MGVGESTGHPRLRSLAGAQARQVLACTNWSAGGLGVSPSGLGGSGIEHSWWLTDRVDRK